MLLYTAIINGIEKNAKTDLKETIREILQETNQEKRLLEELGEEEYEFVVIEGLVTFLSIVQLREGEIKLNESVKIKVKELLQ